MAEFYRIFAEPQYVRTVVNPRLVEGAAKALRTKALVSAGVALLYGASPIDVLPDFLPVLGLVDDAFVVPTFLALAFFQYRKSKRTPTALPPVRL